MESRMESTMYVFNDVQRITNSSETNGRREKAGCYYKDERKKLNSHDEINSSLVEALCHVQISFCYTQWWRKAHILNGRWGKLIGRLEAKVAHDRGSWQFELILILRANVFDIKPMTCTSYHLSCENATRGSDRELNRDSTKPTGRLSTIVQRMKAEMLKYILTPFTYSDKTASNNGVRWVR